MGKTAILVVLAATLGSTLLIHNAKTSAFETESRQADYQKEELAKEIARAGYNIALGQVKREFEAYEDIPETPVAYQHGQYRVTTSGEANRATITSTGTYGNREFTIEGTVEKSNPLSAAVYIDGPTVSPSYTGNAFDITGNDGDLSSHQVREETDLPSVRAVAAREESAVTSLLDELSHVQQDNIYGVNEEDDIHRGEPYVDLQALVEDAQINADETYEGSQHFNGNTHMGSRAHPVVVVVDGDMRVNGNFGGYGMLLVRGDVSLASGNFTWEGIVMAYGDDGVTVDFTGNAKLYGSLVVVPEQFGESNADDTVNFAVGGNSRLQYSSEAIQRLAPKIPALSESPRVMLVSERSYQAGE